MRFDRPNCPECGDLPAAILETMPVHQEIEQGADGEFEYTGGYEDFSEGIEPEEDAEGRLTLICAADSVHQWLAKVLD